MLPSENVNEEISLIQDELFSCQRPPRFDVLRKKII